VETAGEYIDLGYSDRADTVCSGNGTSDLTWNNELLSEVIEEYGAKLRIYLANNLRVYEDVDDLLQELYIRLMTYPELEKVESIKSFVFTIAKNLLRDKSRRAYTRAAKLSVSIDSVDIPIESTNPERIALDQDELKRMSRVIALLPPNCKKAFLLHRIDGCSHKEIALNMGVSTSMVEKHIIEARKQVRIAVTV